MNDQYIGILEFILRYLVIKAQTQRTASLPCVYNQPEGAHIVLAATGQYPGDRETCLQETLYIEKGRQNIY